MAATIKIKNSSTAGAAPTSSDLVQGELAVNVTDKRLFTENSGGTVVELGTNPSSITLPDGSASAPTLLHSGDTNTGLFFPAADTIALTTGGTERLRLDSSGNLGLGTTSPSSYAGDTTLTLNGSSGGGEIDFKSAGTLKGYIYTNGSAFNLVTSTTIPIVFSTNSAERMRIDASGNLQLGMSNGSFSGTRQYINNATLSGTEYFVNGTRTSYSFTTSSAIQIGSATSIPLIFATSDSERARIDSSGNLLVGKTSSSGTNGGIAILPASLTDSYIDICHATGGSTGYYYSVFKYTSSVIGSITQSGTTAVAYNTTSDYRLKENVQPLSGALARVAALKPCTYTWKTAPDEIGEGFIAHELAEVCPQAVTGEKDAVNEDGSIKPQSIDTSFLVATLTAAIQEQQAIIESLTARITALEA